ncbi:MAG: efflux transporter outer membrane subunit [Deltaproteobacteria bacterium]|nr:MAG: efflux transporter outer membrane subunit [Deltaproteobacteria bacterium]
MSGLGDVPQNLLGDIPLPGEQINLFKAGFDAAWEIDLFGRQRRAVEQADALLEAAEAHRDDALVSIIAEVAREYIELRILQKRLDVARANVHIQRETADLVAQRRDAGLASDVEVAQARAQLERSRSRLPALQAAAERTMHRLSVLLGRPPEALAAELEQHRDLPRAPSGIALGMPSSLLQRRADVRAAERELAAATAAVGVATAELFPRFSLSAALGLESQDPADLLRRGSTAWTLASGTRWPVFDAGRARARVRIADARGEQALARFEQTVLRAFEDVENAVSGLVRSRERSVALARAAAAAKRAAELARERHRSGLVDFLAVLDAERTAQSVEDELAVSRGEELTSCIALYKALGGGWNGSDNRAYAEAK